MRAGHTTCLLLTNPAGILLPQRNTVSGPARGDINITRGRAIITGYNANIMCLLLLTFLNWSCDLRPRRIHILCLFCMFEMCVFASLCSKWIKYNRVSVCLSLTVTNRSDFYLWLCIF